MEFGDKNFKSHYKYAQSFKRKHEHNKERNGRYKKEPNGFSRDEIQYLK